MPKKLIYNDGQPFIRQGSYTFRRGEATEVPDDIAEVLIRKGRVKEVAEQKEPGSENIQKKNK